MGGDEYLERQISALSHTVHGLQRETGRLDERTARIPEILAHLKEIERRLLEIERLLPSEEGIKHRVDERIKEKEIERRRYAEDGESKGGVFGLNRQELMIAGIGLTLLGQEAGPAIFEFFMGLG